MDFFNSFFQNVKDKLTSPFFGTLGFILIFHHWEFWYTLFNFDQDCSRPEKLAILRLMASREFSATDIILDILWATIFMLAGYVVVFGTRALALTFDHRLMTWLTQKVVSKNVVLLETHRAVVEERDRYAEQYEEQRQRVRNFSANLDQQTKQIQDKDALILAEGEKVNTLNQKNATFQTRITESSSELELLKVRIEKQSDKITQLENDEEKTLAYIARLEKETFFYRNMFLTENGKKYWNHIAEFPNSIEEKVKELKEIKQFSNFIEFYQVIKHGGNLKAGMLETFEKLQMAEREKTGIKLSPVAEIIGFNSDVLSGTEHRRLL